MFAEDYLELGVPGAEEVAPRAHLFEGFLYQVLNRSPEALAFTSREGAVAIHGHCHAKALGDASVLPELAERVPGTSATLLDTGCCGMAGSFGALRDKYELSLEVARDLVAKLDALEEGTRVVASGTSCRQQIRHLTDRRPLHMAELLAEALPAGHLS
jgi:hypothetical protein